ncbi:MAG: histidinol-phosphatase [Saprospirales bacterium]|nr:histidinol-phosphatase [Saprospirales bacterium]
MQRILFLDRDGTIVLEPLDYRVDSHEKIVFYPGVFQWLGRIVRELDYQLVMITNQDGLGTERLPEERFWPPHQFIIRAFAGEGILFKEEHIDRTFAYENAPTRKPGTGLLTHFMQGGYDLAHSFVIGDRLTDMELAKNLGARGIWLKQDAALGATEIKGPRQELDAVIALTDNNWESVYRFLKALEPSSARWRLAKIFLQALREVGKESKFALALAVSRCGSSVGRAKD